MVALVAAKAAVDLQVCTHTHTHTHTVPLCATYTHTQSRRPPSLMDTPPWGYGAGSAFFREGSAGVAGGGGIISPLAARSPSHPPSSSGQDMQQPGEGGPPVDTHTHTHTTHMHTPYHAYSVPIDGTKINVMRTQGGWYTTAPPPLLSSYHTTKTSGYTTTPPPPHSDFLLQWVCAYRKPLSRLHDEGGFESILDLRSSLLLFLAKKWPAMWARMCFLEAGLMLPLRRLSWLSTGAAPFVVRKPPHTLTPSHQSIALK